MPVQKSRGVSPDVRLCASPTFDFPPAIPLLSVVFLKRVHAEQALLEAGNAFDRRFRSRHRRKIRHLTLQGTSPESKRNP